MSALPITVSPLVIERGEQMERIVNYDVAVNGMTRQGAIVALADYLGLDVEAVHLAIGAWRNRNDATLVRVEA